MELNEFLLQDLSGGRQDETGRASSRRWRRSAAAGVAGGPRGRAIVAIARSDADCMGYFPRADRATATWAHTSDRRQGSAPEPRRPALHRRAVATARLEPAPTRPRAPHTTNPSARSSRRFAMKPNSPNSDPRNRVQGRFLTKR